MPLDPSEKQQAIQALHKRSEFEDNLAIKAYENETFKQQLLADPKSVYERELGTNIPNSFKIEVIQEQPNTIYLVLPRQAETAGAEGELSDEALEAVAGGGSWMSSSWIIDIPRTYRWAIAAS